MARKRYKWSYKYREHNFSTVYSPSEIESRIVGLSFELFQRHRDKCVKRCFNASQTLVWNIALLHAAKGLATNRALMIVSALYVCTLVCMFVYACVPGCTEPCVNNFQWLHSDISAESVKLRVHAKINQTTLKGRRHSKTRHNIK